MTAVVDAKLIIETLIGRELTGEQLGRIGDKFVYNDPFGLGSYVDRSNPTNEEKAQLFLDTILRYSQEIVRLSTTQSETEIAQATIDAAVDTAVSDIE